MGGIAGIGGMMGMGGEDPALDASQTGDTCLGLCPVDRPGVHTLPSLKSGEGILVCSLKVCPYLTYLYFHADTV